MYLAYYIFKEMIFILLLLFYAGCLLGSFLAVLAERIPIKKEFINSRSECTNCHHPLKVLDLIPMFTLICCKNTCRYCHEKIPVYHSMFECLVGLHLIFFFKYYPDPNFDLIFTYLMFLTLSLTDILYGIVEPSILYFCTIILLSHSFLQHTLHYQQFITPIVVYLFFSLLLLFLPNTIGGGDIKLICVFSLINGIYLTIWLVLFASITGIIFILLLTLIKKQTQHLLKFVPFLTTSFLITLLLDI
ncbi:MAG: prepilin peptidase [Vagococcus sp.]